MATQRPAATADAVIIGAGLSGLVAARELRAAGVDDIVVLEARDRVGGRLHDFERPDGSRLTVGGEFTGPPQAQLHALAASLGVDAEPLPALAGGKLVRVYAGERHLEDRPLSSDPPASADHAALVDELEMLRTGVNVRAPWQAASAPQWDRQSVGQWLDDRSAAGPARHAIEIALASFGNLYEVSLLYLLWFLARSDGWRGRAGLGMRFAGGSAEITRRLGVELTDRVVTSCPVRAVDYGTEGVIVEHQYGRTRTRAVVFAVEPGQADRIAFSPALPAARARLQSRWLAGHGAKYFAVYDRPFWRDAGLTGVASGAWPFAMALDVSPTDDHEGILVAMYMGGSALAGQFSTTMSDPSAVRDKVLDTLKLYFGPPARQAQEFYGFDWSGDPWSMGCGTQLPLGVLSTVGYALREPIGPLIWAGADTGDQDWMEGAVTSGQRAAREVIARLDTRSQRRAAIA